MPNFEEKRIHPRKHCDDLWIEITPEQNITSSTIVKAKVDNISDGGICLISKYVFELGQLINFPATMPCSIGTVVWTCQSKLVYKAGVQFNNS